MSFETWAGIVGLVISLGTFVFGVLGLRGSARKHEVESLRREVEDLREAHEECQHQLRALREENITLMERLIKR